MSKRRRDDSDALAEFAWRAFWGTIATLMLVVVAIVTLGRRNRDVLEDINLVWYLRRLLFVACIPLIAAGIGFGGVAYNDYQEVQALQSDPPPQYSPQYEYHQYQVVEKVLNALLMKERIFSIELT